MFVRCAITSLTAVRPLGTKMPYVCLNIRAKPEFHIGSSTLLRVVNRSHANTQGRKYHVVFLRCYDNSSAVMKYGTYISGRIFHSNTVSGCSLPLQ